MNSDQIRTAFVEFFKEKSHKQVLSSSLVPHDDPSILYTNAGMNQFKKYFLGQEIPSYKRAVTVQKVIRAGGKHNDLENVGFTARHHTFFEMLGNFSFGDYFKEKAIEFAWELLTKKYAIPEQKLAVSIYKDDAESLEIWHKKIGVPLHKIAKLGEKDNFWAMGDTGPCGPCSEIHYDLNGPNMGLTEAESLTKDDGRFLEVWNLVFMQYNRDSSAKLVPLPKPSIDTGCGLERISSVLQGVKTNFDTDLFIPIINEICKLANYKFGQDSNNDVAVKVIADHIRAIAFVIADGVVPSNEGRGYVLRRIIRRALRYALKLNLQESALLGLVTFFIAFMKKSYPELEVAKEIILTLLKKEIERFQFTVKNGLSLLENAIANAKKNNLKIISGEEIFKLYDTYGFPVDMAEELLSDEKLSFDKKAFDSCMLQQKTKAKAEQQKNKAASSILNWVPQFKENQKFIGYDKLSTVTKALAIYQNDKETDSIEANKSFFLILEKSPFYAAGGGQVGDKGMLENDQFKIEVIDSFKILDRYVVCNCNVLQSVNAKLNLTDFVNLQARVSNDLRFNAEYNHSATHLLHHALRYSLGNSVRQAGSLVEPRRLRFDFTYHLDIEAAQIEDIENLVNEYINGAYDITTTTLPYAQALEAGALAFFGDKYGDVVRMVNIGGFSKELCGGTHTSNTKNIKIFKILHVQSIAAGVKRVEALTHNFAFNYLTGNTKILASLANSFKSNVESVPEKIMVLKDQIKTQENKIAELEGHLIKNEINSSNLVNGLKFIKANENFDIKNYHSIIKSTLNKNSAIVLQKSGANLNFLMFGAKDSSGLDLKNLFKSLQQNFSAKGGGGADFIQGVLLDAKIEEVEKLIKSMKI